MSILSNLRISHKIIFLMVGLTFGFIAIGVIYYIQVTIDDNSRQLEKQLFEYRANLAEANRRQAGLREAASQLLLLKDNVNLHQYTDLQVVLYQDIQNLSAEAGKFGIAGTFDNLLSTAEQYDQLFTELASELKLLGLDGDSGLRGAMNASAEELEQQLGEVDFIEGLVAYLQMRRHEKNYLARLESTDLASFKAVSRQFDTLVTGADLEQSQTPRLLESKQDYVEHFQSAAQVISLVAEASVKLQTLGEELGGAFATVSANAESLAAAKLAATAEQTQMVQAVVTAIIFTVAMGTAIGIYFIYKSIVFPMAHMQSVIRRINRGKTNARVKQIAGDELGDLGAAFNKLLDERIQHLEDQSHENERLNNSIISLIRALGTIAKKDLTVKVPVSPDITGTISDAVNLLTTETARTLHQVKDISEHVNNISGQLHDQSITVVGLADDERRQVIATTKALEVAASAMNDIARRANTADGLAQQAISHTKSARSTVVETVIGIRTIRETISETEKRMKRLGDRSQEISGIVNLINTISERTHILALNASMHAASAGEAGKGFAVVADEVQRLAENAREATAEISSMVNSIRVETSDTVNIMNTLISQVADGSRLAEQAGQRMDATEQATTQLVDTVQAIAQSSSEQADVANKIRDRANLIRKFTERTGQQLEEQKRFTDSLKHYASTLVDRVNVFALPDSARSKIEFTPVEALPPALPREPETSTQTVA